MQSKVPLYPYSAKDAMKRGELDKWRESFRENCACAGGIDVLIRENFDGMHLKDGTVEKIVELYGYKRVEHVLANTMQERRGDGRFRPDNRAWAESHYIPEDEMHNYRQKHESDFIIADAAARYFRENGISKLPSYKSLQAEIESLIKEKNSGYNDYRAKREEYRRLQTVKGNIDQILRRSEPQRRKEQSHER